MTDSSLKKGGAVIIVEFLSPQMSWCSLSEPKALTEEEADRGCDFFALEFARKYGHTLAQVTPGTVNPEYADLMVVISREEPGFSPECLNAQFYKLEKGRR